MAGPGNRVQQMVIAKLSLNNPSNIWHCSKEICHKTTERKRERERASELDAKCYGNCRKQGTTGWISFISFSRSVNVHNSICLVYAKFNGLLCMVPGYRFWGCPIALQCFVHISDKKNSCNTKVVFNHFHRGSYVYIYICRERERLADQSSFFVATTQPIQGWPSKLAQIRCRWGRKTGPQNTPPINCNRRLNTMKIVVHFVSRHTPYHKTWLLESSNLRQ